MLKDKNIVIVGGQRIGSEIAKALLDQGANVAMTYLKSEDELASVKNMEGIDGTRASFAQSPAPNEDRRGRLMWGQADAMQEESVKGFVEKSARHFGSLHGLVYMASIFPKVTNAFPPDNDWQAMLGVHLLGLDRFMRHLAPIFQKNEDGGRAVIFSDGAAETRRPYAGFRHYLVSKGAASDYVRAAAVDFAPKILVNGIAPGPILPPPDYSEAAIKDVADLTLLKKWGGAEEIVKAALYLLDQNFVTGQVIVVDGGRYLFSK